MLFILFIGVMTMKFDDCLRNQMNLSFDFSSDTAVKHRHCDIQYTLRMKLSTG